MGSTDRDRVKQLILDHRILFVLGAGTSKPPAPLWRDLVRKIAEACGVIADPQAGNAMDSEALESVIDQCLDVAPQCVYREIHRQIPNYATATRSALPMILNLKPKAIITTNFDSYLWHLTTREAGWTLYAYPSLPATSGIKGHIYYIHGHLRYDGYQQSCEERLVFGRRAFDEAYDESRSILPSLLKQVFTYENVIFVGFDPFERHMARILTECIKLRLTIAENEGAESGPQRYILLPTEDSTDGKTEETRIAQIERFRALDIRVIEYPKVEGDFVGLEMELSGWLQEGDPATRPALLLTGFQVDTGSEI